MRLAAKKSLFAKDVNDVVCQKNYPFYAFRVRGCVANHMESEPPRIVHNFVHCTPSLVGNLAAVACFIATQNISYTIWQYKESTSHSFFETPFVHSIWSYFFNKRNLFINIQRLTFHFISTISNVIHVFGHIFFCKGMPLLFTLQMNCQTCSHIFCHIRAQSITFGFTFAKSAVRQCDMKGIFIELCWRQPRVQPFDPCHRRLRMQEDNGLLVALFLIFNFFK